MSTFGKLYGRIDQDLQSGLYRLEFKVNGKLKSLTCFNKC